MTKPVTASFGYELQEALSLLYYVAERKSTIPILATVLAKRRSAKSLSITATNLDQFLTFNVKADHVDAGMQFCTPVDALHAAIKADTEADTAIVETYPEGLRLRMGKRTQTFPVVAIGDFPEPAKKETAATMRITAAGLRNAIDMVAFAISTEETRYYLNGIYMHVVNGAFRMVATDGHRMSNQALPDAVIEGTWPGSILPIAAVNILARALKLVDADAPVIVTVTVDNKGLVFQAGDWTLDTKVIDGTFPDYARVIPLPQTGDPRAVMSGADLVKAIKAAQMKADGGGYRAMAIQFAPGKPAVLSSRSADIDKKTRLPLSTTSAECSCTYTGAPFTIGFNPTYLLDIAKRCETITLEFKDAGTAVRVTGPDQWIGVMMPMRV